MSQVRDVDAFRDPIHYEVREADRKVVDGCLTDDCTDRPPLNAAVI